MPSTSLQSSQGEQIHAREDQEINSMGSRRRSSKLRGESKVCQRSTQAVLPLVLTHVQPLAERAQALQHSQLQLEGQCVAVYGPSSGTHWGLAEEGTGQLGQDIFGEPLPQEVPTRLSQGTQHL